MAIEEKGSMPVDPENRTFAKVPALHEVDPNNTTAVLAARDAYIRESWVNVMELNIIREQLAKCHQREGVNHYQNCQKLVASYMKRLEEGQDRWNWRGQVRGQPDSPEASTQA